MLTSQAKTAHRIGLTPNKVSLIGFFLAISSAIAYALVTSSALWLLLLATLLLLSSGFCDALDGVMARKFQQTTIFGGFLDSILDRYSDAAVYAGIIIAGLSNPYWGLASLIGSMLVSYSRARGEVAGIKMESVGLAERAERMLILAVASIIGYFWVDALNYGIIVLALLSNFTVAQRAVYVYNELKKKAV